MSDAISNRENFEAWYGKPLANLMADPNAGFATVMVAFPILERYLRARSRGEPNTPSFNQALLAVVPELQSDSHANLFWAIYRHGILHQVALSRETHGLSATKPIVEVWPNGKVWMNPNLFAARVLEVIRNNFAVFEAADVPLPAPQRVVEAVPGTNEFVTFFGTGAPPRRDP